MIFQRIKRGDLVKVDRANPDDLTRLPSDVRRMVGIVIGNVGGDPFLWRIQWTTPEGEVRSEGLPDSRFMKA